MLKQVITLVDKYTDKILHQVLRYQRCFSKMYYPFNIFVQRHHPSIYINVQLSYTLSYFTSIQLDNILYKAQKCGHST